MKERIFFTVSYDGTDYAGWQFQPDNISVQQYIESKLEELYVNQPIRVHASGRTDSGVHSIGQTVTFDTPEFPHIPIKNLQLALNNVLPSSIKIENIKVADDPNFHARYSAKGKAYTYVINKSQETPFNTRYSWHQPNCDRLCEMRKSAEMLIGEHDFSSFTTNRKNIQNAVRTIHNIEILEFEEYIAITCYGSGFLYKMVRNIVGLLAGVGNGEIDKNFTKELLESKKRSLGPKSAPPNGLFLMKVFYNENDWKEFKVTKVPFI